MLWSKTTKNTFFHFVEIHESMLGLIPLKYLEGG